MTTLLEPKTYPPSENAGVAEIDDLLHSGDTPTFALVNGSHSVALPAEINAILTQVVAAMRAGKAITVTPQSQSLTTQQAADLLGMSRPTLVKLIDAGEIPCTRTSNRRMLLLDDALEYRRKRRDRQLAAIAATQADLVEDLEPEEMLGILAEARAARRKRIDRG